MHRKMIFVLLLGIIEKYHQEFSHSAPIAITAIIFAVMFGILLSILLIFELIGRLIK
uniref:Uncharacterized protein n=1 Tax=Catagonus wagneri TaxID=51154 RepID=A0A8C3YG53_9CETA